SGAVRSLDDVGGSPRKLPSGGGQGVQARGAAAAIQVKGAVRALDSSAAPPPPRAGGAARPLEADDGTRVEARPAPPPPAPHPPGPPPQETSSPRAATKAVRP